MAYTDPQKIKDLLDPAGNMGSGSAASLEDNVLQGAADRATTEVNSRLGSRYAVPFGDPPPELVVTITTDIAAYGATLSFYGSTDITDTDPVVRRYQSSMQLLADIAAGKADLYPGEDGPPVTATSSGRITVRNPYSGSLFGPDNFNLSSPDLEGWWPTE